MPIIRPILKPLLQIILTALFCLPVLPGTAADESKPPAPQPIAIRDIKRRSPIDFESEILPILKANCLACHNQTTTKADLILETPQTIRKGGESGPAVIPGKPKESLLLQMASHQKRPLMPPKDNKAAAADLRPEELGLIKLWIEQGAKGSVRANIPVQWRPLPKTIHPIYAVALTRDGQFAACGRGNQILVYRIPAGQLIFRLADPKLEKNRSHLDLVQSLDFNPEGTLLASGSFREVKLWQRSVDFKKLPGVSSNSVPNNGQFTNVTFSGSSNFVFSTDSERTVRLQDSAKGKQALELKHGAPITALAVSADGKRIASAGSNNLVKLWSGEGSQIAELKGDRYAIEAIQVAERLATLASNNITFRKSSLQAAETQRTNQVARVSKATATNDFVQKLVSEKKKAFDSAVESKSNAENLFAELQLQLNKLSPSTLTNATNNIAVTTSTNPLTLTEVKTNESVVSTNAVASTNSAELKAVKEKLKEASEKFTAASNAWASAEKELKKAELKKSIAGHELDLANGSLEKALQAVTEAKRLLEKAGQEATARHEEVENLKKRAAASESVVRALAFSADSRILATAGDDSAVHLWSAESGASFEVYRAGTSTLQRVFFPATNIVQAITQSSILQWAVNPAWRLNRTIGSTSGNSPLADRVNAVRFSPDGRLLATGGGEPSRSGEIKLWNVADGKLWRDLPSIHSDTVLALDFSPDGKLLASGAADKFLRVTSADTAKLLKTFEGHTHHVMGVTWKQDGRTLASAGADSIVKVWNANTAERIKNVEGFNKEVTSISFIGVSDQLLASSGDAQVRLVRENGEGVKGFAGAADYVYSAAATPDGKIIIAGGQDGVLRVWNGRDAKLISEFPP